MAKLREYAALILLMVCCLHGRVHAQKECRLLVEPSAGTSVTELGIQSVFPSRSSCLDYVRQLPERLATTGYISASVDSVWEDSANVHIRLYPGTKYRWEQLDVAESDWPLLNSLGFTRSSFNRKPFDQQKVYSLYNRLLDYFADNGYPFATVRLDSVDLSSNSIRAKLRIDRGQLYRIDTIHIYGNVRVSKNFITHYVGIPEKSLYQQSRIDRINSRLAELPFLAQSQPYALHMLNTGAELNFYFREKASNQINALVGFLPANPQTGGKLLVTGEAELNLRNPFGNGEVLAVNWQQFQKKSPRLDLLFERPYLFRSPLGVNMQFQLYKRDSLFLNVHFQAGLSYNLSTRQSVAFFVQLDKSDVLTVDTALVRATRHLPDAIDFTASSIGVSYIFNNTNYRFNPRKGNELQLTTGFGRKNIQENNTILSMRDSSFDFKSLYDTIQQKGYTFRSTVAAAHYFPLGRQATFRTALNAGWFQSPNYFQNELFQIGGVRLLRGFDEESIYTDLYLVGSLEYRYLLGQNSWYFVFTDAGYAANHSVEPAITHSYVGIGTGIAFETKTGIFNISYAVGKRNDLKLDFRQSKIHIGFVSLF